MFAPDTTYRLGLLLGLLCALVLVSAAMFGRRRPVASGEALTPAVRAAELTLRRRVDVVVVVAAAVTLALVAGWALAVLAVLVGVAVIVPARGAKAILVATVAGGCCAAYAALVLHPWAAGGSYAGAWGWVQLCVAAALAAVAAFPPSTGAAG